METSHSRLTAKALETRSQILTAALDLFAAKGYRDATMRDIASAAGVSLGLAYRYFSSKEQLLIAFYERCAGDLRLEIEQLPRESVSRRYTTVMRKVLERLDPYRESFAEMSGVLMNPRNEAGLLSDHVSYIRRESMELFRLVLTEATSSPSVKAIGDLTTIAYAGYLLLLLFWVNDTSAEQSSTDKLLRFVEDMIGSLTLLVRVPLFVKYCSRLSEIVNPMFGA